MLLTFIDHEGTFVGEAQIKMVGNEKAFEEIKATAISIYATEDEYGMSITVEDVSGEESRIAFNSENPSDEEEISETDMAILNSISGYIIDDLQKYEVETISCLVPEEDYETTGIFCDIPELNVSESYVLSVTVCKWKEDDAVKGYYVLVGQHDYEENNIAVIQITL